MDKCREEFEEWYDYHGWKPSEADWLTWQHLWNARHPEVVGSSEVAFWTDGIHVWPADMYPTDYAKEQGWKPLYSAPAPASSVPTVPSVYELDKAYWNGRGGYVHEPIAHIKGIKAVHALLTKGRGAS